jgi:hypothetical protein
MDTRGQDENKVLTARGCHTSPESQGHWSLQSCLQQTEMHLAQLRHTVNVSVNSIHSLSLCKHFIYHCDNNKYIIIMQI